MSALLDKKDEIIMSLVHYFVTEENYTPINVQGVQNEIWLENLEAPYKIVRINSKYIHNNEQLQMDIFKMQYVIDQIKRKTLSFKMKVVNICLDLNESVDVKQKQNKNIETVNIANLSDIKTNKVIGNIFPNIKTSKFKKANNNIDNIINVTGDINKKTIAENEKFENVFRPKKIIITKILIVINILMFIMSYFYSNDYTKNVLLFGALYRPLVLNGDWWRLIACAFLHVNIFHLLVNMYSLWIVGSQVENFIGKLKFLIIYLLSAIMGSLFSLIFLGNNISLGASGAIFGLMGSLIYFGYHYRLYLRQTLIEQLIPIVILNLLLGFMFTSIDNAAHIGGLFGGYLATMIVGLKYKGTRSETINGIIVYILLSTFLIYVLFNLV